MSEVPSLLVGSPKKIEDLRSKPVFDLVGMESFADDSFIGAWHMLKSACSRVQSEKSLGAAAIVNMSLVFGAQTERAEF